MIIKLTDKTSDGLMEIKRIASNDCEITLMIPGEAWVTWRLNNESMHTLANKILNT